MNYENIIWPKNENNTYCLSNYRKNVKRAVVYNIVNDFSNNI